LLQATPTKAQQSNQELAPLTVTGTLPVLSKGQLSPDVAAAPASVTVINLSPAERPNIQSYGDILRPITSVTVDEYGQGGVGYGIALRGFEAGSHGNVVASFVDGVPINQVGSFDAEGYTDLNHLIPQLVGKVELARGPFDVRAGDFALGGSIYYTTDDQPAPGLYMNGGNFGTAGGLGIYSFSTPPVNGYLSLGIQTTDGYRDNDGLKSINTFDKFFFHILDGTLAVRFQIYSNDFGAPGYLNKSLLLSGKLSPTEAIDQSDGGSTGQQNVVLTYREDGTDQPFTGTLYLLHDTFKRWASFEAVPTPVDESGQALNYANRIQTGGTLQKYFLWNLPYGMAADLLIGVGDRTDIARMRDYNTINRQPVGPPNQINDFTESDLFGYAQLDFKPVSWLKLTGGIRYDYFFFDIDDQTNQRAVSLDTGIPNPKVGITITPLAGLSFYANAGQSFTTPNAVNGELSLNPSLRPFKLKSAEIGLAYDSPDLVWHFLADAYYTTFQEELSDNPFPISPTLLGPSIRKGVDLEASYSIVTPQHVQALTFFSNFSTVAARLVDSTNDGGVRSGNALPDVPDFIFTYGLKATFPLFGSDSPNILTLSCYQQWIGPKPITSDRTEVTKTYSRIAFDASYTNKNLKGFSAYVGIIAYPDRRYEESDFNFGPGIIGVSPDAPVSIRGGVFIPF